MVFKEKKRVKGQKRKGPALGIRASLGSSVAPSKRHPARAVCSPKRVIAQPGAYSETEGPLVQQLTLSRGSTK
ncbi:hypothetical protein CHS0354_038833 [Potamilus streckersoni]|uniref:Uncharacterized protein n=1 Tax=Potamilus streckersoni TaxID=2493646 RepID=A0AAE0THT4_9BIVA|nr:hypothetical protein CHS0354_038833 [Potamilus streckersoni]